MLTRRAVLKRGIVAGAGLLAGCAMKDGPFVIASKGADEAPVATTRHGKVRGYVDNDIFAFKGISYGDDTSKRRFMAPVPPQAWTGVKETVKFGPRAPQGGGGGGGAGARGRGPASGPAASFAGAEPISED